MRVKQTVVKISFFLALVTTSFGALAQLNPDDYVIDTQAVVQTISQNVPAQMETGKTYDVSIQVKNVGTSPWTPAGHYTLQILPSQGGHQWIPTGLNLDKGEEIVPGAIKTYEFTVTAPRRAGRYDFRWQFLHQGKPVKGSLPPPAKIVVEDPQTRSQFVSQLAPDQLSAGEAARIIIQYRNIGTSSWTAANGFKLVAVTPRTKEIWGVDEVRLPKGKIILPNQTVTFTVNMRAPWEPGSYTLQWQMARGDRGIFGLPTPPITLVVGRASRAMDAEFVSQNVPRRMIANEVRKVTVLFKNTGSEAWDPSTVRLTARRGNDDMTWMVNQINLEAGEKVEPGDFKAFSFNIVAPPEPGFYSFQWQLRHQDGTWIGEPSEEVEIRVARP